MLFNKKEDKNFIEHNQQESDNMKSRIGNFFKECEDEIKKQINENEPKVTDSIDKIGSTIKEAIKSDGVKNSVNVISSSAKGVLKVLMRSKKEVEALITNDKTANEEDEKKDVDNVDNVDKSQKEDDISK